jgi:ABC-type glycerol-3-phosphate transport system substrate-binding protein
MMGALQGSMGLLSALRSRRSRHLGLWASLISSAALAGCSAVPQLPNMLYLAIGMSADQAIDGEAHQEVQDRLAPLEQGYRQLHPSTRFQFSLYPETDLGKTIRDRTQSGLGPDLLFLNGATALKLLDDGLVDPYPANARDTAQFNPGDLDRIRDRRGRLAGIPVLVQTQVACFNRKQLATPPATLDELLAASAKGRRIGLSADVINLFWTAGSLGAVESITNVVKGNPIEQQQLNTLIRWLAWLQNANNQLRVTFYPNQQTVISEFLAGRLDWIPCNSISLPRLRQRLKAQLGVSPLPDGVGGAASPVNRLRVLALGHSSSSAGRARALAFSRFSTNPMVQRVLTLGSQTVLPANRFVKVPVQSSEVLEAMETSQQESHVISSFLESIHAGDSRMNKVQAELTILLFGERSPEEVAATLVTAFQRSQ